MKTETISDNTSVANGRTTDEPDTTALKAPSDEPPANAGRSSELMLGLLDEFTKIYKDKLERLENSSLKMEEKGYLQAKVSLLERWLGELGEQNAVLVGAVGELEREAASRVSLLRESVADVSSASASSADALASHRQQLVEALEGRAAAEERVLELTEELSTSRERCSALQADLDTLLQVVSRGRTAGNWRCDDVTFHCLSSDQVCGAVVPSSGRTTPSCGLKGSISPTDPQYTDPFPLIGRPSEVRSSSSNAQRGCDDGLEGRDGTLESRCSDGQDGADEAALQLSVNIDVLAARLADAERECELSRAEVCQLRAECETLRERASEAELSHECCDAAVARLHRELQESLQISRELQQQMASREASPGPASVPLLGGSAAPPPPPEASQTTRRSTRDAGVMAVPLSCEAGVPDWDIRVRVCRLENEVSEKGILVRELQGHLAAARHECCLKDSTIKKVEQKLTAVRADLCAREDRRQYLERQLVLLQRQLARTHAQAEELARQVEQKGQVVQKLEQESWSLAGQLNARAAGADALQLTADHVAQELIARNTEVAQQRLTIASLQDALASSRHTCDVLRAQLDEDVSRHVDPARPAPRPHVLATNTSRGLDVADDAKNNNDNNSSGVEISSGLSKDGPVQVTKSPTKNGPKNDDLSLSRELACVADGGCESDKNSSLGGPSNVEAVNNLSTFSPMVSTSAIESRSLEKTDVSTASALSALSTNAALPVEQSSLSCKVSSSESRSSLSNQTHSFSGLNALDNPPVVSSFANQLTLDNKSKSPAPQDNILRLNGGSGNAAVSSPLNTTSDYNHTKITSTANSKAVKSKASKEAPDDIKSDSPITTQPQSVTVPITIGSCDQVIEKSNTMNCTSEATPVSLTNSSVQFANSADSSNATAAADASIVHSRENGVLSRVSTPGSKENNAVIPKRDGGVNTSIGLRTENSVSSSLNLLSQSKPESSMPVFQLSPKEPVGIINNNVFPFHTPSMNFPSITPIYSETLNTDVTSPGSANVSGREGACSTEAAAGTQESNYPTVNLDDLQRCALPDYLSPGSVLNLSRVQSYHLAPNISSGVTPQRPALACDYSLPESRLFPGQGELAQNGPASLSVNSPFYSEQVPSEAFHSSFWSSSGGFQRPGFFRRPKDYVIPCRKPDAKQGEILDV